MQIIKSISELHRLLGLAPPLHPMVSVALLSEIHAENTSIWEQFFTEFYTISLKNNIQSKVTYGQQPYDFDKGTMTFTAPKQIQSVEIPETINAPMGTGYVLMFHPDFIKHQSLQTDIKSYNFFTYAVSEALHVSEQEEQHIIEIFQKIEKEYAHIDQHTQDIILAHIELLLKYCNRFYQRQFITRKAVHTDILSQMEYLLNGYFDHSKTLQQGLPTVEYLADQLNLSANYLSDLLRSLTGQNAQQHIHNTLIDKAKEKLRTTNVSVSTIAYELGFEQPQSLNRLFKKKTAMTPLEFRKLYRN